MRCVRGVFRGVSDGESAEFLVFFFPSSKLRVERRHTHQLTFTFHTSITPLMEQTEIQRSTERRRIRGGRCVSVGGQRSEEDEQTEGEEQRPSSTEELSVAWCLLSYFLLHLLLSPPLSSSFIISSFPFVSCPQKRSEPQKCPITTFLYSD